MNLERELENAVMLDLETMSDLPTAAIVEIGAVHIASDRAFSIHVDLDSCLNLGLTVNASTVRWWLGRSDESRAALLGGEPQSLPGALLSLCTWTREVETDAETHVFCHSSFDAPILVNAFAACRLMEHLPFDIHLRCRDLRTIFAHHDAPKLERQGVHHSAVDDCRHQIKRLRTVLS